MPVGKGGKEISWLVPTALKKVVPSVAAGVTKKILEFKLLP